jgi:hypothetical protein
LDVTCDNRVDDLIFQVGGSGMFFAFLQEWSGGLWLKERETVIQLAVSRANSHGLGCFVFTVFVEISRALK